MKVLFVLFCIALVLWLIGMIKASVVIAYKDELELDVWVLGIRIRIAPKSKKVPDPDKYSPEKYRKMLEKQAKKERKKEEKKAKKEAKKKTKKAEKASKSVAKESQTADSTDKKKKSMTDIMGIVSTVLDVVTGLFKSFGRHLQITSVRLKITVATGDAATTAIAYGGVCAAVSGLMELLRKITNFKIVKRDDVVVDYDYLSEKINVDIKIIFSLRVWHVFAMIFAAAGRFIKRLIKKAK